MKKFFAFFAVCAVSLCVFAQKNNTVNIDDDVYEILINGETNGLCSTLSAMRPYSVSYIVLKLNEIKSNLENNKTESYVYKSQIKIIDSYLEKYTPQEAGFNLDTLGTRYLNNIKGVDLSLQADFGIETEVSAGFYSNSDFNQKSIMGIGKVSLSGDIGNNLSYGCYAYVGGAKNPLTEIETTGDGRYLIGKWWFGYPDENGIIDESVGRSKERYINTYRNFAYMPYSYKKFWDGDVHPLSHMDNSSMAGWPFELSLSYGMNGELHAAFLDNSIELGFGRYYRELGAMDKGSSLVMNSYAHPFVGIDGKFEFFNAAKLFFITGVLEYPNQDFIYEDAWYNATDDQDAKFFQNAFSILEFACDFKYVHFDFGSAAIWPKRFELGYLSPFQDKSMYQNNVGDYDNVAMFGNLKFRYPGIGSLWISGYLDEMPDFAGDMFERTRTMFAVQFGAKTVFPVLPFGNVSFRYTKIEPYCYTHHAINYTPYYSEYLSEAYITGGTNLGYYLEPNSDEFLIRIDSKPAVNSTLAFQYQLIRHGADYGSHQVRGSSIYSEMDNQGRGDLKKYFLRDGAYEWTNALTLCGSYDFKKFNVPLKLVGTFGVVHTFWTDTDFASDEDQYEKRDYYKIDTDEYPTSIGVVTTLGVRAFFR